MTTTGGTAGTSVRYLAAWLSRYGTSVTLETAGRTKSNSEGSRYNASATDDPDLTGATRPVAVTVTVAQHKKKTRGREVPVPPALRVLGAPWTKQSRT